MLDIDYSFVNPNGITFFANQDGREELQDNIDAWGEMGAFHDMLDSLSMIGNGWESIDGYLALCGDPYLIGYDCQFDDDMDGLIDFEFAYHFPDYAVVSLMEQLVKYGQVFMPMVEKD